MLPQLVHHVSNGVLRARNAQAVSRHNDDRLGGHQHFRNVVGVDFLVLALDLHGLASTCAGCSIAAKNDIWQRAVHRSTHNVREDGAREADQRARHRQERILEHEALSSEGPAGVAVEQGDHHRHVSTADGCRHVGAQHTGRGRGGGQARHAQHGVPRAQEQRAREQVGAEETQVDHVLVRQVERAGRDEALQLEVGRDRAGQGDGANERAKVGGDRLHA
mmetsp:Transcript_17243/g.43953  ORF Transcript_17243/g.43953 Transcript_17243/m.43953 type:complete len:220 (-) Transcript_17243:2257-2916(-)